MNKLFGLALSVVLFAACSSDDGATPPNEDGVSFAVEALHYDCYTFSGNPPTHPPAIRIIHAFDDGTAELEMDGATGKGTWYGETYVVMDFTVDGWNASASLPFEDGAGNGRAYKGDTYCAFDFTSKML